MKTTTINDIIERISKQHDTHKDNIYALYRMKIDDYKYRDANKKIHREQSLYEHRALGVIEEYYWRKCI